MQNFLPKRYWRFVAKKFCGNTSPVICVASLAVCVAGMVVLMTVGATRSFAQVSPNHYGTRPIYEVAVSDVAVSENAQPQEREYIVGLPSYITVQKPFSVAVDASQNYTIFEKNIPVLTYRFGETPLPPGVEPHHFGKGPTDYDGAYFSDGSAFGGARSDYIHPLYGFSGETLTVDFPKDHLHHRGLWWSWCEVRHGEKIGDLWAVNKIRAYPLDIRYETSAHQSAQIEAVNVWRFDDETDPVVQETVTITVHPTQTVHPVQEGETGVRRRAIDVEVRLEGLVEGVSISGRQGVDYGGYGGMAIRLNESVENFRVRAVHPNPDDWNGRKAGFATELSDPARFGDAAWLALSGDFPLDEKGTAGLTIFMMEKKTTPRYPNPFRYYGSFCATLAFPAKHYVTLEKGVPLDYKTRIVLCEGTLSPEEQHVLFDHGQ